VISEGQLVPLYSVAREAVNKAGYNSEITLAQTEVNKERCLAATMEKGKRSSHLDRNVSGPFRLANIDARQISRVA
jgi:hypothetical protein